MKNNGRRRRSNKRGRPRRSGVLNNMDTITTQVPFRFFHTFSYSAATTVNSIAFDGILSGFSTRILDMSSNWQYFRYSRLKLIVFPFADSTTPSNTFAFGFFHDITGATAAAFSEIEECGVSMFKSGQETVKSSLTVPRSTLRLSPERWFSVSSASGNVETTQLNLRIAPRASSTVTLQMAVEGVIEYKGLTISNVDKSLVSEPEEEVIEKVVVRVGTKPAISRKNN